MADATPQAANPLRVQGQSSPQVHRHWLFLARAAWLAITLLLLLLYGSSLFLSYDQAVRYVIVMSGSPISPEALRTGLEQLGLSIHLYAGYQVVVGVVFVLAYCLVGALIFWRKANEPLLFLISLWLVIFGTTFTPAIEVLEEQAPLWGGLTSVLSSLSFMFFFLSFYLFPDGCFVPRWTRWPAALFALCIGATEFLPGSLLDINTWHPLLAFPVWSIWAVSMTYAQFYRYRYISGPVQRQQTKWGVVGLATPLIGFLALWLVDEQFPLLKQPGVPAFLFDLAFGTTLALTFLLIPLTIGFAMLRYRLWDVDVVIRRTLIYSTLTIGLGFVYFVSVVLLQQLLRLTTGEGQNQFATVASTLTIAVLFTQLRGWVQAGIDRRFYRRKYNAERVLAAFGTTVRNETDLGQMTAQLLIVVQETMQPVHVSLWLREPQNEVKP
jgi:hypothetical protein